MSHAKEDTWVARQIAAHVVGCGAGTFLDNADIQHGDDFEERILEAAETSTELVVLLTPWAMGRPYIMWEVGIFRGQRKRIVGVLHGLTAAEVVADPDTLVTFKKLDMLSINDLDQYFEQLRDRVDATETTA